MIGKNINPDTQIPGIFRELGFTTRDLQISLPIPVYSEFHKKSNLGANSG